MANENKINYEELASARLAGVGVDEFRASRGGPVSDRTAEDEDWTPTGKPTRGNTEEGLTFASRGSKIFEKSHNSKTSPDRHSETKETVSLPTAEQCEILQNHPDYHLFKDGMKQIFLNEIKDLDLTLEQRKDEFESICREFLQADIKVLVERGNLKDWQQFVAAKAKKSATDVVPEGAFDGSAEIVVPVGKFDDTEAVLEATEASSIVKAETKTEAKDWREVKRETEVFIIGDLHGNIEALEGNLEKLGLIKNDKGLLEWSGGKARIVFEGDILGDRNTNGLNILYKIGRLQEQAKKVGGEIEIIAGNHDDFATSFLMDVDGAGNADAFESCRQGGYLGLLELARYGSSELQQSMGKALAFQAKGSPSTWSRRNMEAFGDLNAIREGHGAWQMLKAERPQILENMRNNPKGRQILEAICNMKLVTRKDDALVVHTNPTREMVRYLQSGPNLDVTIKFVNEWYQQSLRKSLLRGEQVKPEFLAIKSLFLNTDNREDFVNTYDTDPDPEKFRIEAKDMVEKFKTSGVNALVHGHSDEGQRVRGKSFDFPIISVDFSAYKSKGRFESKSVLKIAKDGKMQIGKDMETIRS